MLVRPKCFIDNGQDVNICDDIGEPMYCSRCTSYKNWSIAYKFVEKLMCPMCGYYIAGDAWLPEECRDNKLEYRWRCQCGYYVQYYDRPITQEDVDREAKVYEPECEILVECLNKKVPDEDLYEMRAFEVGEGMDGGWDSMWGNPPYQEPVKREVKDYSGLIEELEYED